MEDYKYRMLNEATKIFSSLEKEVFRKIMVDKYRCSAKCCDNTTASTEDVVRCRQTCEMPLQRAREHVQQEVNIFMSCAGREYMDCKKWSGEESETNQLQMKEAFEVCANKCVNKHINKLPEFSKRLEAALKNM